jgi:hypothetical protein
VTGVLVPPKRAAPNLVANFLPVRFQGETFMADVVPFDSAERLTSLRHELRGTHVVRRDGNRIVCVPLLPETLEVGDREKFAIGDHRGLTMGLVKEALIREVIAMKYKLCGFARPSFVSRYRQQDLVAQCAGDRRQALAGVHVYPQRITAARSGKMPTTSVRLPISRFRRSWGLLLQT